jgi:hypothetical protein
MIEQQEFYRKLAGGAIVGIGTKNMEHLHTVTVRTSSGELIYICGDMTCMTPEEWIKR